MKRDSIKPKTLITIGILTAFISLVGILANTLTILFTFHKNAIILQLVVWSIIVPNCLMILFCASFVFALLRRLFKTSLFLLIGYFLFFVVWSFVKAEYFNYLAVFFGTLWVFLLSLGVFGVYKGKYMVVGRNC